MSRRFPDKPMRRGPNGRYLCRYCDKEITAPRRKSFCGNDCVHEFLLRRDFTYLRRVVFERDKGVCATCGLDTVKWWREQRRTDLTKAAGLHGRMSAWDADHIKPVVEGGGACGLDNIQTLCVWCHRQKTAAANRARKRKACS